MTREDLSAKAAFVREALERLDDLPRASLQEFLDDPRNLASALHWMQTAIQALIDIGLMVVATRGLPTPRSSSDMLAQLEAAGALPEGAALRFRPVVGFRNRVVHLYDRIDPEIAFGVVAEHRQDLVELLDLLLSAAEADGA